MSDFLDRAREATTTTGTGDITLSGVAQPGFQTFNAAGAVSGNSIGVAIEEGTNWEEGDYVYNTTTHVLTRGTPIASSNSGSPISLAGGAVVTAVPLKKTVVNKTGDTMTGTLVLPQTGLKLKDASTHGVTIKINETETADRTLNVVLGDADRTITLAGNLIKAAGSDVRTATDDAKFVTSKALADSSGIITLTDGSTVNWDMSTGYNSKVTLGGNRTLAAPTNPIEGRTYTLQVIQDGTGSRTLTWPSAFDFGAAGSPTLQTGTGKIDFVALFCRDASTPKFTAVFTKGA